MDSIQRLRLVGDFAEMQRDRFCSVDRREMLRAIR
jgi:hypothetical protein